MKRIYLFFLFWMFLYGVKGQHYSLSADGTPLLTQEGASHFAALAMNCIVKEFPNKTGHIQVDAEDCMTPAQFHPAFYGCFDWHSSVHGHWMLVKLLKNFPSMPEAEEIRNRINNNITVDNILAEVKYFEGNMNRSYERTYGWAWLLKLAEELYQWDDVDGRNWSLALDPLVDLIVEKYVDYLPKQVYATRVGTHTNTAFGLSFALDYAIKSGRDAFAILLKQRSEYYFKNDLNCPAKWEPGAADFFSPCLQEAELMAKVLPSEIYDEWLNAFLPQLNDTGSNLFFPVSVSDRTDLSLVHLDGLNLSRAWCFIFISSKIDNQTLQQRLRQAAIDHLNASLSQIADGDYAGEHWLASFAVYALLQ